MRLTERAAAPLAGVAGATFAFLSAVRRKRVFHPDGVIFEGTVTFHDNTPLPFSGEHGAIVRFSQGIGLPTAAPDILGLAVKLPELDQDLLLVTSGEGSVSRHLLMPANGFFQRPYSSVLPYDFRGDQIVFGARPDRSLLDLSDQNMDDLPAHVATGRLRFDLTWGRAGTEDVATFGSLVIDRPGPSEVKFNPFNVVEGLRPAGGLNRLRLNAYRKSQQARPDA